MTDPALFLSGITATLLAPSDPGGSVVASQTAPLPGTTALSEELIRLARGGQDTTALADELIAMARGEWPGGDIGTLDPVSATAGELGEASSPFAGLLGTLVKVAPLAAVVVQALRHGAEPAVIAASLAPAAIGGFQQAAAEGSDDPAVQAFHQGASAQALAEQFIQSSADGLSPQSLAGLAGGDLTGAGFVGGDMASSGAGTTLAQVAEGVRDPAGAIARALGNTDVGRTLQTADAAADRVRGVADQARGKANQVRGYADQARALPQQARADAPALRSSRPEVAWPAGFGDAQDLLIALDTPGSLPLKVERFEGHEAVCAPFQFQIDCLSPSAFLDLQPLLGQPLQLNLRTADHRWRHWHGYCTQVAPLGSDGGLARYRLTLAPWTAFLSLRRNALIFQDKTVLGVVEQVFADYPQAVYRSEVTQSLPVFPIITQYRETDEAFVTRLLAEAGLAWRFEQPGDGPPANPSNNPNNPNNSEEDPRHVLVIFDRSAELPPATPDTLRFHRIDATEHEDAITHFGEQRQAVPDAVSTASWQAEQVQALAAISTADPVGQVPSREHYTSPRAGRHATPDQAQQQADRLLDALRLPQRLHAGAGSGRGLAPGAVFTLTQHPDLGGQAFVPLAVEHVAANHLGSGVVALLDDPGLERGSYRNRFLAVPQGTPIVPAHRPRPLAPGAQSARVVGLPEAANTASRDHQVRIQFAWQRGTAPHAGGLTDTASTGTPEGHAPSNERSGTWVRVAEWLAGPNWGSHTLPRIGSEVLVEFLHADIDQPLVTGQLYNGQVAPPFALAEASNHPGTLSGLHHGGIDGSGHQQWVIDDAPGQLRQRLATTVADSRLELGYLIQHADSTRGGYRGQGFELATAGWGNLHAGQGLLLSTSARTNHRSTQLDVTEAVGQLKAAEQRAQALSEAAVQQQVPALSANAQQSAWLKAIDPEQDGQYSGSIGGQPATKPKAGAREGGDPVERFATPLLFAESPDSLAAATPQSALAYAGGAMHLTVQDDAHFAAGQTFAAVAGQHAALYAHAGPLRVIAANGPVTVQAHTGALELLADQSVTITATDERIDVLAQTKIVLQAGQSQLVLEGGDIRFECPGNFTVKASQHPFRGGGQGNVNLSLPNGLVNIKPQRMLDFSG